MKLASLLAPVFPDLHRPLTAEDSPATIAGWDSLRQVEIVLIVEETFRLTLSTQEIAQIRSLGQLAAVLHQRGIDVDV